MISISPELVQRLSRGFRIPPHPAILDELEQELEQNKPAISNITGMIERDPGMVSSVLMIVNSSAFMLTHRIDNIRQAIMLLGLETIRVLTIASLLNRSFDKVEHTSALQQFWNTTLDVSKVARYLYAQLNVEAAEDHVQLLSLFYSCGIPVMASKYHNYADIMTYSQKHHVDLAEHEDKTYATSHPIVGFLMAKKWKIPSEVCLMILNFSQNDIMDVLEHPAHQRAFAIVKLAQNIVSETRTLKPVNAWLDIRDSLFSALNLAPESYAELVKEVVNETKLST